MSQSRERASADNLRMRAAEQQDFEQIWPIFRAIVAAGDTYGFAPDTGKAQARRLWMELPQKTFVAERGGKVLGTYYLKPNFDGPGAHVCNCGYMVDPPARGQGLATAMCRHSEQVALELGYKAMQFNFVAASNEGAVRLWASLGFETAGRLPKAFRHPALGYVDALVMYKWLRSGGHSRQDAQRLEGRTARQNVETGG